MIDVHHKLCIINTCKQRALYGTTNVLYCKKHKIDNMINYNNKQCKYPNCVEACYYNLPDHPAMYCILHKTDDMINVCNKTCNEFNCLLIPSYNVKVDYHYIVKSIKQIVWLMLSNVCVNLKTVYQDLYMIYHLVKVDFVKHIN